MTAWRRSEPRDLRPFFGADQLGRVLDGAAVRLRPGEEPIEGPRIVLDQGDLERAEVTILPALRQDELLEVLAHRAACYALAITLRDPMFMHRLRSRTWPISEPLPEVVPISESDLRIFGHGRAIEIGLSLCLAEDCAPEPGWPSVTGSWIARKRFVLGIRSNRSAFDIQPLTEEVRKLNRLAPGALVFAEILGSIAEPTEEGGAFATVYLAESILAALHAERKDPSLNAVVEAEIVAAVLSAIVPELDEVADVEKGTPMARVLDQLGGNLPMELDQFRDLARDPQRLRAVIHDRVGLVSMLEKL